MINVGSSVRFEAVTLLLVVFALWLIQVLLPGKCAGWGFAFWFPLTAVSGIASFVGLLALPVALAKSEGMGSGFAKFGAIVVFSYAIPAWVVFAVSLLRRPRQPGDFRAKSLLIGSGLFVALLMVAWALLRSRTF